MHRNDILQSLRKNPQVDVLVIGGGINGVGTFRDLALNGVNVLLVERGDFCSGASAASSHMAHGGIRYLENGEFRLVREAVRERNRLIENAPHAVKPLPTTIPIFKIYSGLLNAPFKFLGLLDRPAERGAVVIKIGLMVYDAFTRAQGTVPRHKFQKRELALEKFPRLNPEIRYAATYYDGAILSPERLTVELVLDAEAEGTHAQALNYVSLAGIEDSRVRLRDELTGATLDVSPRLIVNAAGAWIDRTNLSLGRPTQYIGGTKGSHLVLDHPELRAAIGRHEFFFESEDGRIVLIFPLRERVLIGTSDIPIDDPDKAACTEDEIDYLLGLVKRVFPDIHVGREHIVFRYAGVRPLAYSKARTAGQITRDHSIREDRVGTLPVYSLVGGKWTTYRAFAEQVADKVLSFLGRPRRAGTQSLPIGGGRDYPWTGYAQLQFYNQVGGQTGLPGTEPKKLFGRYGTRAQDVAAYIMAGVDAPLTNKPDWTRREVAFLALNEKVLHLDDLILRRSNLGMAGGLTRPLLEELAGVLGESLGWTDEVQKGEVQRMCQILAERHGVQI